MHKENQSDATDPRLWGIKKSDVIAFVLSYGIGFLMLHYDVNRKHMFQNPMPVPKAALLATPLAFLGVLFANFKKKR